MSHLHLNKYFEALAYIDGFIPIDVNHVYLEVNPIHCYSIELIPKQAYTGFDP